MNRKKKVTGQASSDSMQVHGQASQDGPVGKADGYQDRRDAQNGGPQRTGQTNSASPLGGGVNRPQSQPLNRPKTVSGQSTGSMNTFGQAPQSQPQQQARPTGAAQSPFAARPQQAQQTQQTQQTQQINRPSTVSNNTTRASSGSKSPMMLILIVAAVLLLGGGGGLSGLFGGGDSNTSSTNNDSQAGSLLEGLLGGDTTTNNDSQAGSLLEGLLGGDTTTTSNTSGQAGSLLGTLMGGGDSSGAFSGYTSSMLSQLLGGSWYGDQTGITQQTASTGQTYTANTSYASNSGTLNRNVAAGSRNKYTTILGNNRDQGTVMVYMCGADLESRSAMGTKDLQEMINATFGDNLRVIVYTGGSTKWQNQYVSSSVNQIWQVSSGKLTCLEKNMGTATMTNPATLSSFIQYCAKNFPANRYALILWDHGSGSVSGYGYDEKNPRSGSMSLAGLNTAFKDGGVKFDFIGFDACLMATVENALMASNYADYLIASEETEPGIGWYYTDWLTAWGKNTSLATLDIGKQICDDFVSKCATSCRGQQTTLSLIDLAELSNTVPAKLTSFSKSVTSLITNKEYKTVSNARNGCREFATSSRIDQVDLTDLCAKLGTDESQALASVLREAVKYNRINNISNAYGLSIYFPYQKVSNVDKAVSTYAAIGMDDSYAQAIRAFASVEASGQAVTGGNSSAIPSLFGSLGGGSSLSSGSSSGDMISELLGSFLGGGFGRVANLDADNTDFLSGSALDQTAMAEFLTANLLDAQNLVFQKDGDNWVLEMKPEQWALVTGVDQNVFYDNGAGYVDLGLDNLFEIDEQGRLVADMDGTWLAINGQPVPYYHETSQYLEDGGWIITGTVPALLNDVRVDLLIVFDSAHEDGYVSGARAVYTDETETVAKADTEINAGDTLVFLADLYDYDQNYTASYHFGNPITVEGDLAVSNVYLPDQTKMSVTYRITDLYNQAYWTPIIGK